MARNRKRFYIARRNGYGQKWDVLRLRFVPEAEIFNYSHSDIMGPFRTSAGACLAADYRGAVTVAEAETMVASSHPVAA